ncbi:MAG: glycosyltransferase [Selenomonas sp.]|uniref:glycosyltransferase family 2 protein n=1 Tax=Selenomonas sp. TaxID=2053611 RepID=UPI0025EC81C2|nr:glycosyltransferase [Selenomonas sp.]MCR5439574.1 glycosyltransferase [Selenomonas sp.]
MRISACYIVKNEEKNIVQSIRSIQGVYDELIVLDTGSSDATKETALSLGARVYDYSWQDDFATARNEVLKHVSGDWIVFLDADEAYQGTDSLRGLIEGIAATKENYDAIVFFRWDVDEKMQRVQEIPTRVVRAFRNVPNLYFEGRIHEKLINDSAAMRYYLATEDYWFSHTGYAEGILTRKFERNLQCLLQDIERRGLLDEHYFYLAITYFGLKNFEKAGKYARLAINSHVHYAESDAWPWHILIESQRQCGLAGEVQLATAAEAVKKFPQQAEFYSELGIILSSLGRIDESADALWQGIRLYESPGRKKIRFGYFSDKSLAIVYCRLAQVEELRGNLAVAELAYRVSQRHDHQRQDTQSCYKAFQDKCRSKIEKGKLLPFFMESLENKDYRHWLRLWQRVREHLQSNLEIWWLICLSLDDDQRLLPHEEQALPERVQFLWQVLTTRGEITDLRVEQNVEVRSRMPLVSVMIPTYNMPELFKRTMRSAALQTYPNIEILVCDNSTNEETAHIMADYAEDSRVHYIRNTGAENKADNFIPFEQLARGEYLQWLMHDDILCPTKIEKMAADLYDNPQITLVASQRQIIDVDGRIMPSHLKTDIIDSACEKKMFAGEDVGQTILTGYLNFIGEPSSVLFRRDDLQHNYWRADCRGYKTISDVVMWLELMEKGNLILYRDALSYFRRHDEQEGQGVDVVLLSRIEWLKLGEEYYRRNVFLHTRKDYEAGLRILVDEYYESIRLAYGWKEEASADMWHRYEAAIHKARILLGMKR